MLPKTNDISLSHAMYSDSQWENAYYRLANFCYSDECLIKNRKEFTEIIFGKSVFEDALVQKGWSTKEANERWANTLESTVRLVSASNSYQSLTFVALTLKEPQKVDVFMDDQFLGSRNLNTEWNSYFFTLPNSYPTGAHKITFKYSHLYQPSQLGISTDARQLAVCF